MTGTIINIIAVLIGGTLGLLFGSRLPDRLKSTVIAGIGLFTAAIGIQMFLETENSLIVLGALLIGALLGEWWKIEDGLQNLGRRARRTRFAPGPLHNQAATDTHFVRGFLTASLLFCVGPMTILGSIQDGLTGNYELLAVKSVLDGFASLAFASTLGIGVLFSHAGYPGLPGRHQPAGRATECVGHHAHAKRDDRYRRRDPDGAGHQ